MCFASASVRLAAALMCNTAVQNSLAAMVCSTVALTITFNSHCQVHEIHCYDIAPTFALLLPNMYH
jgi:hypothetical protein